MYVSNVAAWRLRILALAGLCLIGCDAWWKWGNPPGVVIAVQCLCIIAVVGALIADILD